MGIMSDYYAAQDAEYERLNDDRSLMQICLDSKDAEESVSAKVETRQPDSTLVCR